MSIKVSKEEMERESILKTKDGLYKLGMMKVKRDQKKEKILNRFNKSIDYIFDKETTYPSKDHTTHELLTFLESLTDGQFQKLSKFFETSPTLKHDIELHCKNKSKLSKGEKKKECGYKEKITLEGLNSFFA